MVVSRITREDRVEQSVTDFIRDALFNVRNYPADRVELLDAFQPSTFEAMSALDKSYLALGFNFDQSAEQAELGSTLTFRTYLIEVWVIADSPVTGRNLANAVREIIDGAQVIPLKDIAVAGAPVIDQLIADYAKVERQPVPDPKPWQENIWIVYLPIHDEYYA